MTTIHFHITDNNGIHYLYAINEDMKIARRPVAKRDLLLLYRDIAAHLSDETGKTAPSVEQGNIFLKRKGKRFTIACRDDGYEFPIERHNLVSIHLDAHRVLITDNTSYKRGRKTKAVLMLSRQLEMFPDYPHIAQITKGA